jgi:arginine exporter protein ArgO
LVAAGVAGSTLPQTASFVTGFVGGTFAWAFMMAAAIRLSKRLVSPGLFRAINFACGTALLTFSVTLASQMLG